MYSWKDKRIDRLNKELTKEVNSINRITQDLLQKEIKDLQDLNEFAKTYQEENKQVA